MNKICGTCEHQGLTHSGNVGCMKAGLRQGEDGYGPFKAGANCTHDIDLEDLYTPIPTQGQSKNTAEVINIVRILREDLCALQDENSKLKDRLTKI